MLLRRIVQNIAIVPEYCKLQIAIMLIQGHCLHMGRFPSIEIKYSFELHKILMLWFIAILLYCLEDIAIIGKLSGDCINIAMVGGIFQSYCNFMLLLQSYCM